MVRSYLPLIRGNEKHLGSTSAGFHQLIKGGFSFLFTLFLCNCRYLLILVQFFCLIHHIWWIQPCYLFDSADQKATIKASAARAQPSHMYFYSLPTGQNIWLSNGSRISCIDLRNVNGAIDTELGSYIRITAAHLFNLETFFPWVNKHPLIRNTKTLHEGQKVTEVSGCNFPTLST